MNNDAYLLPQVDLYLSAEKRLEGLIAIRSIYNPLDILKVCGDYCPKVNIDAVNYWEKLLENKASIETNPGNYSTAYDLLDSKEFSRLSKLDKLGAVDIPETINKIQKYRYARTCFIDIQDDLNDVMGRLCLL